MVIIPARSNLNPPVTSIATFSVSYSPLLFFTNPPKNSLPPMVCLLVLNVSTVWVDPKVFNSRTRIPPNSTLGIFVLTRESATLPTTPVFSPTNTLKFKDPVNAPRKLISVVTAPITSNRAPSASAAAVILR